MDNDTLLMQLQEKIEKLCSSVAGINAKMENVLTNSKKLERVDGRLRDLEQAFVSFKSETKTRLALYAAIASLLFSVLAKGFNSHF